MEHSGNILIFNIPGTLFWEYSSEFHRELFPNILGIYHGNVPRISCKQYSWNIISEYSPEFHRKLFPNILGIHHGNVPRIFHEQYSWNIIWEYSPEFHSEHFPNILRIYHGNVLPRTYICPVGSTTIHKIFETNSSFHVK